MARSLVFLSVLVCALIPLTAAAGGSAGPKVDHSTLDAILEARVRDGLVDYLSIRKHDYAALVRYISDSSRADPSPLSRDERLALYFNLYNAVMIRGVIDRFHAGYSPADGSYEIFDEPLLALGDRKVSLNQLEHEILRREFREPRLHVALVCAAVSCPPLLPRAYRADDLDEVLHANMRRFIDDPSRNRIDHAGRRLLLSRIFDWYAEDFGGPAAVASYVERISGQDVGGYAVAFLDYDWKLNIAPPERGRWIEVTPQRADLVGRPGAGSGDRNARQGEVYEVLEDRGGWLKLDLPRRDPAWIASSDTVPYP